MDQSEIKKALVELRKEPQRKFEQTVELIVNLTKFNPKKDSVNTVIVLPHKTKDKKIAAFLESKNPHVDTITLEEFRKYEGKKELKGIVKKYDFFISQASLMPKVATSFGKVLGPAGKMPSPQLGIVPKLDDKTLDELKDKVNKSIKVRTKEASIKITVGKEKMNDNDIADNILSFYNSLLKVLPRQKENVKNVMIKFTMTKPIKIVF